MSKRIALISSHPIQYYAPLFALMAKEPEIDLKVFYTWGDTALGPKFDPDFGKEIEWDIPLLVGYKYTFLNNTSKDPGSHHFKGIINPSLIQEIEDWGPDVVWVWGWAFDSHLKVMRYFKGKVPVWFRGDSTLLDEPNRFSLRKTVRRIFLTWVYKHIDKAFYVGTHNKAYFKAHGLKENQLVYAPHAIDNERFADPTGKFTDNAKSWRKSIGYKENDFVLMYVGKFEPNKNLKDLITKINNSQIYLVLVGNGPLEEELKQMASENIQFLPFQNQSKLPALYRLANAVILNSNSETWGLVINEALACGVPVFASAKCGGALDLLEKSNIFSNISSQEMITRLLKSNKGYISSKIDYHTYTVIIESIKKTECNF